MRNQFINLLRTTERPGIENLIDYLDNKTDFFTAPASANNHGNHEGGLLDHSMTVYKNLTTIAAEFDVMHDSPSLVIVALLHDLCKANFYKADTRNVKKDGVWTQVPYFSIDDQLPLGHGEKSVIILQQFIRLTIDEVMAIRWHMAGYDDAGKQYAGGMALGNAMNKYPLITALHMADLSATFFDKK